MVNPDRLYPDIEEDQVYLNARQTSDLTGESFNYIYTFSWLAENMSDFSAVIEFIAGIVEGFGLPLHFDREDMIPDEEWVTNMRTAGAPLFSESYEIKDPETGEGTGNFRTPYDFLGGANALMVTAIIMAIGFFGGRHLILKHKGKAAAGIMAASTSILAAKKTKDRFTNIFENFDDVDLALAEGDISSQLHGAMNTSLNKTNNMDILETINMLVNALDSNKNSDVKLLRNYIVTGKLARETRTLSD